jgi:hypothetical protein
MDAGGSRVSCYSGHTYAQHPRAFSWQGETYEVSAVVSEAHTPRGKKFVVKTTGGKLFNLDYTIDIDHWQVSPAYPTDIPRRNP